MQFGQKGIPYLNTYDGRTICNPDPLIRVNDTIKVDLETNKIIDFIKFDVGNVVVVTGGCNRVHVEVIKNREKHKGSFETIHSGCNWSWVGNQAWKCVYDWKRHKAMGFSFKGQGYQALNYRGGKERLVAASATTA